MPERTSTPHGDKCSREDSDEKFAHLKSNRRTYLLIAGGLFAGLLRSSVIRDRTVSTPGISTYGYGGELLHRKPVQQFTVSDDGTIDSRRSAGEIDSREGPPGPFSGECSKWETIVIPDGATVVVRQEQETSPTRTIVVLFDSAGNLESIGFMGICRSKVALTTDSQNQLHLISITSLDSNRLDYTLSAESDPSLLAISVANTIPKRSVHREQLGYGRAGYGGIQSR